MRYLENSYDKVTMKTEEARQVQRVYLDIKARFEQVKVEYMYHVVGYCELNLDPSLFCTLNA